MSGTAARLQLSSEVRSPSKSSFAAFASVWVGNALAIGIVTDTTRLCSRMRTPEIESTGRMVRSLKYSARAFVTFSNNA
ncbi:hypothetical protein D3C84_1241770 [compost metagenome]